MKTKEILGLDFRKEENQKVIMKVLKMIKPLSKFSGEIPFSALEKVMYRMCYKYGIYVCIRCDTKSGKDCPIWGFSFCWIDNLEPFKDIAYGCTLYEALAKANILVYSEIKRKGTKDEK